MADPPHDLTGMPALRHLAIVSAARDFGASSADIERVVRRFNPFRTSPRELADALADALTPESTA